MNQIVPTLTKTEIAHFIVVMNSFPAKSRFYTAGIRLSMRGVNKLVLENYTL